MDEQDKKTLMEVLQYDLKEPTLTPLTKPEGAPEGYGEFRVPVKDFLVSTWTLGTAPETMPHKESERIALVLNGSIEVTSAEGNHKQVAGCGQAVFIDAGIEATIKPLQENTRIAIASRG